MARRAVTVDLATFLLPDQVRDAYLADIQAKLDAAVVESLANLPNIASAVADKVTAMQLDALYRTTFNTQDPRYGLDMSAALQAATNAARAAGGGRVIVPPGSFNVTSTITTYPGVAISGSGKGVTSLGHSDASFLFKSISSNSNPTARYQRFDITDMSIYAKNAVQVNDPDDYMAGKHPVDYIMGARFTGVRFAVPNSSVQTAAGAGSTTVPAVADLRAQGVGLQLTECYDTIIENCEFEGYGIAVFLDDSDVTTIRSNRFERNSRHVHNTHHGTGGARVTIERNDILTHFRMGGIYADTPAFTVSNNYFEPIFAGIANTSPQILRTEGRDIGLLVVNNSIDMGSSAAPVISSAGGVDQIIDNNHLFFNADGAGHAVEVRYDFAAWDPTHLNPVHWGTNPGFNKPWNVAQGTPDPYVFEAGSIPEGSSGGALGSFPFIKSPNHGRPVLRTDAVGITLRFRLKNTSRRNFRLYYTGRKVAGAGYRYINYVENGSSTVIFAGSNLGFTATNGVETKSETFSLPAGAQGTGYFDVSLSNDQIEYERVELVPTLP
jgi:hypothetical protein